MATSKDFPDPRQLFEGLFGGSVKDSAQQVWLAGLGALAKAQQEGGRVFESLVKEGAAFQQQNPNVSGQRLAEAAARVGEFAAEAGARAAEPWDRLEGIFEERVARALGRLGMPSAAQVEALTRQVDELSARLDALTAVRPRAPAKKAPAKRTLARPRP